MRPTLADPAPIDVAGGPIEWREWPATVDGLAPLVLLHEGLGSVGLWRSFPERLAVATGRRVVAFSRHSHGRSAVVTRTRGVDYMHQEARTVLPSVLDELGVERPVLVGHSDGASIALIAVGEGIVEAEALVLLAPHVIVEDLSVAGIEAAKQAFLHTDLPTRMAKHHDDVEALFWGWNDVWLSPAFRDWDIRECLGGVAVPILAIQGTDDSYGTLRQLDEIEDRVTGPFARVELSDCDHAPHLERQEETVEAVASFVRDPK